MKIGDRHPVEPLPEGAWDRVRQAVFAELDAAVTAGESTPLRKRAGWRVPLTVLSAATAAAFAIALSWRTPSADERRGPLASTRIVTGQEAAASTLGDVAVDVAPHTALVAVEDAAGWLVVFEQGAAVFAVPKTEGRRPFVVRSGSVRVEVVGTRFRVERVGDAARVDTYEGMVRVEAGGRSVLLRRGERWPASPADLAATGDPSEPVVAGALPAPESARALPDAAAPQPARARPDVAAPDYARRAFERAASLEVSDPEAAIRSYRRLARERGEWAANALYALARLELERGDETAAARELRRYLKQYPRGANAADARKLLERIGNRMRGETDR
jgi:hypothetical protein